MTNQNDDTSRGTSGKGHQDKVRKADLDELRQEIRRLWQDFLSAEATPRMESIEEAPYMESLEEAPYPYIEEEEPLAVVEAAEEVEPIRTLEVLEEEAPEEWIPLPLLLWWIPALVFYGFGDVLTSRLCVAVGAMEANPIAKLLLGLPSGLIIFSLFKTVVILILVFISYYFMRRYGWIIPLILTLVGIYLVANNVITLIEIT